MESNSTSRGRFNDPQRDSYTWSELREDETIEFSLDEDPWAWADKEAADVERVDISQAHVTAVLVAFDAARWLPATLAALAGLQDKPARLIAIDNGSTDATRTLLDRAHDQGIIHAVYAGEAGLGFGAGRSGRAAPGPGAPGPRHRRRRSGRPTLTNTTGSGCCTTTRRPPRTRSTSC